MKIYTKTGDSGETGLFAGARVWKNHPRIEAFGEVDELNALLGLARAQSLPDDVDRLLAQIQNDLFALGAVLATPQAGKHGIAFAAGTRAVELERSIDDFETELAPLRQFILPGGSPEAAALHVARTVCRRAERRIVELMQSSVEQVSNDLVVYVNRLGDLLFVMARVANARRKIADVPWQT